MNDKDNTENTNDTPPPVEQEEEIIFPNKDPEKPKTPTGKSQLNLSLSPQDDAPPSGAGTPQRSGRRVRRVWRG